jgi:hypothetical protein
MFRWRAEIDPRIPRKSHVDVVSADLRQPVNEMVEEARDLAIRFLEREKLLLDALINELVQDPVLEEAAITELFAAHGTSELRADMKAAASPPSLLEQVRQRLTGPRATDQQYRLGFLRTEIPPEP